VFAIRIEEPHLHGSMMSRLFGRNLRHARLQANLTQLGLAKRAGLRQQYVSLIEKGTQNVTIDVATKLALALQCELWTLLSTHYPFQ
jgi:transcriptional regulator with XRE-family HTH domain